MSEKPKIRQLSLEDMAKECTGDGFEGFGIMAKRILNISDSQSQTEHNEGKFETYKKWVANVHNS